ncbi:MAG: xanthine dehydrogenase accessory protein XdhC [Alphaproteobacteria bacterium]|nr:xanthine dehydrogenase accessory protein XdhC [Alphaproteobacteria bacterium]
MSGSTPREVGARIILDDAGRFGGSIGGGNLENSSIQQAQKMLSLNTQNIHTEKHLLGPDMGQCCGGAVTTMIEIFTPQQLPEIEILTTAETNGKFTTIGDIGTHHVTRKIAPHDTNQTQKLVETFGQNPTPIYLFGAGHVGKALMLHLASLPFQVTWIDSRKSEFPKATPSNFTLIHLNQPHKALAQAPDNAQLLILTHNHDLDFDIVQTALQMNRFAYIGMIGSKTKRARFISKFKKQGLTQQQINQLICPIGLPNIKSKNPKAIAVSVVAELLTRVEI